MSTVLPNRASKVDVTANKTLTAASCGTVQNVVASGVTITLPAAAAGLFFVVRNGGKPIGSGGTAGSLSDGNLVTIAPNGTDTIQGGGKGAAANANLVNTALTALIGDMVELLGISGGWTICQQIGIWV